MNAHNNSGGTGTTFAADFVAAPADARAGLDTTATLDVAGAVSIQQFDLKVCCRSPGRLRR